MKSKKLLSFLISLALAATAASVPAATAATVKTEPASAAKASDFSWDNASVYFLLTDRFNNGNTSNDHSYNRGLNEDGSVTDKMKSDAAMFRGGDFAGVTQKITEGYFDKLGVTALWISAPYEQILGYCCGGGGKMAIPHYAYHGYYAGDYSNFDKNFGTEEEFKTMVQAAHEKGIRIVLDVVMNHPGYNTMYDMNELGFGKLLDGWKDEYYAYKGNEETYHNFINYDEGGKDEEAKTLWGNWWGADWLRAGISGYEGFNGISASDAEKYSAGGFLPERKQARNSSFVVFDRYKKSPYNGVYSAARGRRHQRYRKLRRSCSHRHGGGSRTPQRI